MPLLPPIADIHRDILYESPGSTNNKLDVYLPLGKVHQDATILVIHGGGWIYGDKSDQAAIAELLAAGGYPVVTCNYTLSTIESPAYPQAVYDVKAVMRWIRTEGASYFEIPEKVVVMGDSAGGYLALMLGTTDGVERFEPMGSFAGGYRADGVISFFAPGDLVYQAMHGFDWLSTAWFIGGLIDDQWMPLYVEASPITYLTADCPPMALLHGGADDVVPIESSVLWRQAVAAVCRSCRLIEVADAGHGFDGFGGNSGVSELVEELVPSLLAGRREPDLNGDGEVDAQDAQLFAGMLVDPDAYSSTHAGCSQLQGDLNGDGVIDGRDIAFVARRVLEN